MNSKTKILKTIDYSPLESHYITFVCPNCYAQHVESRFSSDPKDCLYVVSMCCECIDKIDDIDAEYGLIFYDKNNLIIKVDEDCEEIDIPE